ncbi:MAG: NAD-dependent epimerase/dehydratase family protein [Chloroflexi bacterium]|nr:NAD-dependent epimerase/dehydratase family protein [Chloroflexota bacterium]
MRILVTGASGFIGEAVARAAAEAGHAVRAVARSEGRLHVLDDAPIEQLALPSLTPEVLRPALEGVDVLVHCAAGYVYGRGAAERAVRDNPLLTRDVLTAAQDAGTKHVIDISSAVVLKPHPDGPAIGVTDPGSPHWAPGDPHWGDPYLRSKVLAEEVADAFRIRGVPVSTIYPTAVVGPGDRVPGTSGGYLRAILTGRSVIDGALGWTDVRDLAEVILRVAEAPPGGRYLVSIGTRRMRTIARIADSVTGRRRRRVVLPAPVVRFVARLNDLAGGRIAPGAPPPASLEYQLTLGPTDGSSGRTVLGHPYRELSETLRDGFAWWVAQGLLDARTAGRAVPAETARAPIGG